MQSMILAPSQPWIEVPIRYRNCGRWYRRNNLRTPRRLLPRWGRPQAIVNASAGVQINDDGAELVNNSGAVVVADDGDDCCKTCCNSGTICQDIPTIPITFSGLTLCSGCRQPENIAGSWVSGQTDVLLDGTYDLTCGTHSSSVATGAVSAWWTWDEQSAPGSPWGTVYDGFGCTDTSYDLVWKVINLFIADGYWLVTAYLADSNYVRDRLWYEQSSFGASAATLWRTAGVRPAMTYTACNNHITFVADYAFCSAGNSGFNINGTATT